MTTTGCKLFTKTAGGSMVKYSALAIGKWFVAYAETEEDADTSNLRVQKLLYYAQGYYLARKGVPLFDEAIQAWSHGPVVPEVYHVFRRFGSNPVKLDKSDDFNFSDIDEETTQFLLEVWSAYASYSTWALRNMTHNEKPWKNTFNGSLNVPISIEEIGKYFASVPNAPPPEPPTNDEINALWNCCGDHDEGGGHYGNIFQFARAALKRWGK